MSHLRRGENALFRKLGPARSLRQCPQTPLALPGGAGLFEVAQAAAGENPFRYRRGAAERRRSPRGAAFAEYVCHVETFSLWVAPRRKIEGGQNHRFAN